MPKYWDIQTKVVFDLSPSHTLLFNGLYGDNRINLSGDPKEEDELRKNRLDSSSVQTCITDNSLRVALQDAAREGRLFTPDGLHIRFLHQRSTSAKILPCSRGPSREKCFPCPQHPRCSQRWIRVVLRGKFGLFLKPHERHDLSAGVQVLTSRASAE
jgi:hypothetical protein